MGMSTHVVGFKPPDDKWEAMKEVWVACAAARVDLPEEVEKLFGGEPPDPEGVEVSEDELRNIGAVRRWEGESSVGVEIAVSLLPKDVTVIRFYNAWRVP